MKITRVLAVGAIATALLVGCGASTDDAKVKIADKAEVSTTTTSKPKATTTTERIVTTATTAPPTTTTAPPPPPTTTTTAYVPPPPPTTVYEPPPPPAPAPSGGCDPNYSGCVPIASDVDCAGGSGNGPAYTSGPVQVIGSDIYGLDSDNDGVGCE